MYFSVHNSGATYSPPGQEGVREEGLGLSERLLPGVSERERGEAPAAPQHPREEDLALLPDVAQQLLPVSDVL